MIPLFITGAGAVTSLGLDASRTIASLRAGQDGLTELPFAGQRGKDLRGAPVRGYAEGLLGEPRIVALAARALGECLAALRREESGAPVVFLGLPAPGTPSARAGLDIFVANELQRRFGLPPGSVRTICEGPTSVFSALRRAEASLQTGARACIVGGVDSLTGPDELRVLSDGGLLSETYDGFFPGEAAAFVCVSRRSTLGVWGRRAAAVLGFGEAIETADGTASAPLVGVGMAAAMRAAMTDAKLPEGAIGMCINSVNGARAGFEDEAYAQIRVLRSPRKHLPLWHPASYLGETGAAYGALALVLAAGGLELGFAEDSGILLTATAGQRRAAVFVQSPEMGKVVDPSAPAVGIAEPCVHTVAPIVSTRELADDPGWRLDEIDDAHARLAESDFDGLSALLLVRMHHLGSGSPWTDIAGYERRALAHLDALAWSNGDMRERCMGALDREPEEAAAASLVLGCTKPLGPELDALVAACEASPEHRDAIVDHLALCPGKLAEPCLERLLAHDDADLREAALRGFGIGGWLTLERLATPALASRAAADTGALVCALGKVRARNYGPWALGWLRARAASPSLLPTLAVMALADSAAALGELSAEVRRELVPEAFAIGCLRDGVSLLTVLAKVAPSRGAMIALGWSGEWAGTPLLLAGLDGEDDVAEQAALSLARLYGLRPSETIEVEEDDDDGDASEPQPKGTQDRLSRDRKQWEEALKPLADAFPPRARIRGGRVWTKGSARAWLLDPGMPCNERDVAAWEHAIVNEVAVPIDPRQLVATQERKLRA